MTGIEGPALERALQAQGATAPQAVLFIRLLLLSGARCGEIAAAKWDWLEGSVLKLPDAKAGPRDVHLPPQVMTLLGKVSRTGETIVGISDPSKTWRKIRAAAGCPDLRLHDLRRSFASCALSAGVSLSQVGELLGHRSAQTTKTYAYLMEEAAQAAATVAAGRIEEMMSGPLARVIVTKFALAPIYPL